MKKLLQIQLLTFISILISSGCWAQKNQHNSLLWKISKKGNANYSFLFGTIHVICEADYFWTKAMQQSFDESKQLCLEMDVSNSGLSAETAALMIDFSGGTLRDYFEKEEDFQLVKHYIEDSLGQNMDIVERLKPVALFMMYSVGMVKGSCKESVSYELKLAEQANKISKKIIGLETVNEQMEALESIPTDTIIQQMISIAKGEKNEASATIEMISAYKKQDLRKLNQMIVASSNEGGLDGTVFVDNRNRKWIKPMSEIMSEKSTFFAVGAGHLYGLLQLLREAGYSVEAVH